MSTNGLTNMLRRIISNSSFGFLKRPSQAAVCRRWMSTEEPTKTEGETKLLDILKEKFPDHTELSVEDVSGGCGAFYLVQMEAAEFKGVRTLKRHQMVKEALKEEIKDLHGLKLDLRAPS